MKNIEIEMQQAVREERLSTTRVITLINLAEDSRVHLERGYSSLHDWLITVHRYSEGAANRRVQAARIIRAVPEAQEKLEDGIHTLTTLALAQSYTKTLPVEMKREILMQLENLSGEQAKRLLAKHFPERKKQDTYTPIDEKTTRLSVSVPNETVFKLKALRDEMSHKLKTIGEVIAAIVAEKRCAAAGSCTYQDPKTGKVCGGTFLLEKDHIQPKGKGGSNRPENLRLLCRAHNILEAEKSYGREHMDQFKTRSHTSASSRSRT